jgi:hypothetical protein
MNATEDVIAAVKTQLTANLETQIAAIESSRSVTIERWKVLADYADFSRKVPSIEIVPASVEIGRGDDDAPITESVTFTSVDIFVSAAGTKPEDNGKLLSRYAEAITAVIDADNTLGGEVDWAYVTDVEWADFSAVREDKSIETSLRIGVQAKKHG